MGPHFVLVKYKFSRMRPKLNAIANAIANTPHSVPQNDTCTN